jgi:hypothetical protein
MVSNTGIAPNSEVFNTYGETLTNSQLLNQYGFVLDVNENDRLLWSAPEILDMCVKGEEPVEAAILKASDVLLGSLLDLSYFFDQSQLVCLDSGERHGLYLNDEGKISAGLWALLAAIALMSSLQITDIELDSGKQLMDIVDVQLSVESFSGEVDDMVEANLTASNIVLQIARFVVDLCEKRKKQSGKSDSNECNLSDLLEVNVCHLFHFATEGLAQQIPQCYRRTRLAISVLLTERSILDACQAGWLSILSINLDSNITA